MCVWHCTCIHAYLRTCLQCGRTCRSACCPCARHETCTQAHNRQQNVHGRQYQSARYASRVVSSGTYGHVPKATDTWLVGCTLIQGNIIQTVVKQTRSCVDVTRLSPVHDGEELIVRAAEDINIAERVKAVPCHMV